MALLFRSFLIPIRQTEIRSKSRDAAPDIDGWISQAKTLRFDSEKSLVQAGEIGEQARNGRLSKERAQDIARKTYLLEEEVEFTRDLSNILGRLRSLHHNLDMIQHDIVNNSPLRAAQSLDDFGSQLPLSTSIGNVRASGLLENVYIDYREEVTNELVQGWNECVRIHAHKNEIEIFQKPKSESLRHVYTSVVANQFAGVDTLNLHTLSQAFLKLGTFDTVLKPLCVDIKRLILLPRIQVRPQGHTASLHVNAASISTAGQSSDLSAQLLFSDLERFLEFWKAILPDSVLRPVCEAVVPFLTSKVISMWLMSAIPESLNEIQPFKDTLELASRFADVLEKFHGPAKKEFQGWIDRVSDIWFAKRRDNALDSIRRLISQGFGETEAVERVETQVVSEVSDVLVTNGEADEWNSTWSDDGERTPGPPSQTKSPVTDRGEEDMSAWGLEEEQNHQGSSTNQESLRSTEDDGDAWGWNEDEEVEEQPLPTSAQVPAQVSKLERTPQNGKSKSEHPAERMVTLTEIYHITSLPKNIFKTIDHVLSDASVLQKASTSVQIIASAAPGLLSIPNLVLSLFRATAPSAYSLHTSGNMFLYNDCLWLSTTLSSLPNEPREIEHGGIKLDSRATARKIDLDSDVRALESLGKQRYAKEMESQRRIITDILDGAQGFIHCTQHPFNQECDIAIASAIDRIRMLHRDWSSVLSKTALLQSTGSLVTTITSKIVLDIEDMSDISEPESQQLVKLCSSVASLEDLFIPEGQQGGRGSLPATAFYVPNWFKFQYLVNILESSLVDIKFMWTESELSLEFRKDELIDLILALFADSQHRRSAIAEIRHT